MKRAKPISLLAVMMGALVGGTAHAALISVTPTFQSASINDTVSVDIVVSNLAADESVGGVSLLLSFDDSILAGDSYVLDPNSDMGGAIDLTSGFAGTGDESPLELFFLAVLFDHADLKPLQGDSFIAASVSFKAIANGLSFLNLAVVPTEGIFLSNADGTAPVAAQAVNGSVCVGDPAGCAVRVPEPETLLLLGLGLALVATRRRSRLIG
jgi:hypothetical protein